MAVYKVPQDVEADDKLIGPFSFRQFIYLIIVAASIAMGYGLSRLFIPLAIIPLPIVLFFGALALPLRKDQPMEIYLAAVVSFYLKPRKRMWQPDGRQTLIEITAPKVVEVQRAKDLSQTEAEKRLSYLASIVDTRGWAVRGVNETPSASNSMQTDAFFAAQQTEDVLDNDSGVARSFDTMIGQADAKRHDQMLQTMRQSQAQEPIIATPAVPDPYATLSPVQATASVITEPQQSTDTASHVSFNPYPNSIHQSVIQPLEEQAKQAATQAMSAQPVIQPTTPSETHVSPDIINLANNPDLSIETIAHEARRIQEKEHAKPDDEVVISLR